MFSEQLQREQIRDKIEALKKAITKQELDLSQCQDTNVKKIEKIQALCWEKERCMRQYDGELDELEKQR